MRIYRKICFASKRNVAIFTLLSNAAYALGLAGIIDSSILGIVTILLYFPASLSSPFFFLLSNKHVLKGIDLDIFDFIIPASQMALYGYGLMIGSLWWVFVTEIFVRKRNGLT